MHSWIRSKMKPITCQSDYIIADYQETNQDFPENLMILEEETAGHGAAEIVAIIYIQLYD